MKGAEQFILIPASGPVISHTLVFAVNATELCATHNGLDDNIKSSTVISGVTLKVPDELPVIAKAVLAPLRQSNAAGALVRRYSSLLKTGYPSRSPKPSDCGSRTIALHPIPDANRRHRVAAP